jgi:imidazolonepropionase-like amidohydrolase
VGDLYGTLEPGKKANFIVLDKDPSERIANTRTIRAVWKNGEKASGGPL